MSQEEFSSRLGCSLDDVKAIENEYPANIDQTTGVWVVKDLDFLFTIADILEVDVPAFFFPNLIDEYTKIVGEEIEIKEEWWQEFVPGYGNGLNSGKSGENIIYSRDILDVRNGGQSDKKIDY